MNISPNFPRKSPNHLTRRALTMALAVTAVAGCTNSNSSHNSAIDGIPSIAYPSLPERTLPSFSVPEATSTTSVEVNANDILNVRVEKDTKKFAYFMNNIAMSGDSTIGAASSEDSEGNITSSITKYKANGDGTLTRYQAYTTYSKTTNGAPAPDTAQVDSFIFSKDIVNPVMTMAETDNYKNGNSVEFRRMDAGWRIVTRDFKQPHATYNSTERIMDANGVVKPLTVAFESREATVISDNMSEMQQLIGTQAPIIK